MKEETIQNIFCPINDAEWMLIKTDKSLYSLRLGGFKRELDLAESMIDYEEVVHPFKHRKVEEIYTDKEWVYFLLEGGGVIASGWIDVSLDGELRLGVKFTELNEYEHGFFDSGIFSKLTVGADNWSKML